MAWTVELDVWDVPQATDKASELGLLVNVIAEVGPAGGNSIVEFRGRMEDVCAMIDYHATDAEDAVFLKKKIFLT